MKNYDRPGMYEGGLLPIDKLWQVRGTTIGVHRNMVGRYLLYHWVPSSTLPSAYIVTGEQQRCRGGAVYCRLAYTVRQRGSCDAITQSVCRSDTANIGGVNDSCKFGFV